MITSFIFDLDDTLVQTERLKALSYARAACILRPDLREADAVDAFKDFVGGSRKDVARGLLTRLGLERAARERLVEFGVREPWEVFVALRVPIYESILSDDGLLERSVIPHNVALLKWAREHGYKTGLATMSHLPQTRHVLEALHLNAMFDMIATQEDVRNGKPDPEIYLYVARALGATPSQCLVIEDSPNGVRAAQAAGMRVIAVTTDYSREAFASGTLLDKEFVVDAPQRLTAVVDHTLNMKE